MKQIFGLAVLLSLSAPTYGQNFQLLLEHLYFGDEIDQSLSSSSWMGLFEENGTLVLKECEIEITSAFHPLVDNEGEQSGLEVTSNPRGSRVLIYGVNPNDRLQSIGLSLNVFDPGYKEQFEFLGSQYELRATGTVEKIQDGDVVSDYTLTLWSDGTPQILGESDFFDEAMFYALWAGDIDGDGKLDLLLDLSYKYSFGLFSLFLSSRAEHGQLVKLASQHKVYYD